MNAEVWAQIKRFFELEHLPLSEIARRLDLDRKTVRRALGGANLPARRPSQIKPSKLDPYKTYLAQRLKEHPSLPGTMLFREIQTLGYPGRPRILWEYLQNIRPRAKEVFLRIETLPGEQAQVDWANCGSIQIGNASRKLSCFVMVLSYSRMMYLEFTLSQCLEDFISCHIHAFDFFGGIPKAILYDNLKTVCLSRFGSDIRFNQKFLEFSGIYLFEPVLCNPGRGNEKGKVENGIRYVRSSFLLGRTITSWPQLQAATRTWRDETANTRIHGTTREKPIERFNKEKDSLTPLPRVPYDPSIVRTLKATSQALIHFDGNAYSLPHPFAYKAILLKASPHEVRLFDIQDSAHKLLAIHNRSFERGIVVEDPKHYAGLLEEKRKAFASKLKDSFLSLGSDSEAYLQGLLKAELNLPHHIKEIMDFVRIYGKTEVLGAMAHALRFGAFGASYLKNIILQSRSSRGLKDSPPIVIHAKPDWTKLAVDTQDLSLYDQLFESQDVKPQNPMED